MKHPYSTCTLRLLVLSLSLLPGLPLAAGDPVSPPELTHPGYLPATPPGIFELPPIDPLFERLNATTSFKEIDP